MFTQLRNFLHDQPPFLPQCSSLCSLKCVLQCLLWVLTLDPGTLMGQTIRDLVFPRDDFSWDSFALCHSSMPSNISLPSSPGSRIRAPYLTQDKTSVGTYSWQQMGSWRFKHRSEQWYGTNRKNGNEDVVQIQDRYSTEQIRLKRILGEGKDGGKWNQIQYIYCEDWWGIWARGAGEGNGGKWKIFGPWGTSWWKGIT